MSDSIDKSLSVAKRRLKTPRPTNVQRIYLMRGLQQPGGKLPLFDVDGQRYKAQTIQSCIKNGWCEHWFRNPAKPDWLVCKLTEQGRKALKSK
ncbi:hypothetical protein [Kordiimonas aquimaris]|uniref:hypothetical protein n=1 Tax=Kordiimonas aquimaris TaxID=707591 RepID=UPI0021CFC619|nr:hypothetical protein [Kordiimonas aquimaris]